MTRKAPQPVWRSLGRYGDDGPWNVHLPGHRPGEPCAGCDATPPAPCLAQRYTATARLRRDGRALLGVSIKDRNTGATFEWAARRNRVTTTQPSDATTASRDRLWRDGRYIIGLAQQVGRPSEREERIAAYRTAVLALHDAKWATSRITAVVVLQRLGRTGDDSQLREDVGGWAAFRESVLGYTYKAGL